MKLYHFCAMQQGAYPGVLTYKDGTITTDVELNDLEQYTKLKRLIAEQMDTNSQEPTGLVLLSLTLIGEVPPNA